MAEYIGDAGIVTNNDPRELGGAINQLLLDEIRIKFENKVVERVNLFSIEHHAKECLNYFNLLLGSK